MVCIVSNAFLDRNMWYYQGQLKTDLLLRFKESEFYPLFRRRHFTEIDIFSFVGGLLGLFLGFSVLSMVEILYFCVIKVCFKKTSQAYESSNMSWTTHGAGFNCLQFRCRFIVDYMRESSVHGLAYIADKSKHFVERYIFTFALVFKRLQRIYYLRRLIWMIAFLISMIGCVLMINKLHSKLGIDTITMVLDVGSHSVSVLPFPAITIFGPHEKIDFYTYWVTSFNVIINLRAHGVQILVLQVWNRRNSTGFVRKRN
jgi:Amiloride-sensitive sodium channel